MSHVMNEDTFVLSLSKDERENHTSTSSVQTEISND